MKKIARSLGATTAIFGMVLLIGVVWFGTSYIFFYEVKVLGDRVAYSFLVSIVAAFLFLIKIAFTNGDK